MEKVSTVQDYFDSANAFMVALDSSGAITDINKKALECLGYTKSELLGKNWFDNVLASEKKGEIRELFNRTLSAQLEHMHYQHSVVTKQDKKNQF